MALADLGSGDRPAIKAGPFGSSLKKEYYVESGYKIYGQEQVLAGDPHIGDYYIDRSRFESLCSCEVIPGDLLITLVGSVGRVLLVPDDAEPGIINPRLVRLSVNRATVNAAYVRYWLTGDVANGLMQRLAQGGTMGVINATLLGGLRIPLPPLPEQRAIAEVLGTWDEAIALAERRLEAARQRKRGLLQVLLTGRRRFPEFAGQPWREVRLGEMGACIRGVSYKPEDLRAADMPGSVRLLRATNITDAGIDTRDVYRIASERCSPAQRLQSGDIAVCMSSGSPQIVGKAALFTTQDGLDYTVGAFCAIYRTHDGRMAPYVNHLIQSDDYRRGIARLNAGTNIQNLKPSDIHGITFPMPQSASERTAVELVLAACDEEIDLLARKVAALEEQKKGLMQRLLTGQVRVAT